MRIESVKKESKVGSSALVNGWDRKERYEMEWGKLRF